MSDQQKRPARRGRRRLSKRSSPPSPRRFRKLEQSRQRPRRARAIPTARSTPSGTRSRFGPTSSEMVFNLSEVLAGAERDEERQRGDARGGADQLRTIAEVQTELGLAEAAMRDFAAAEQRLSGGDPARSARRSRLSGARPAARESEPRRRSRRAGRRGEARGVAGAGARLPQGLVAAPPGPLRRGAAAGRGDARTDQSGPPRPAARRDCTTGSATAQRAFAAFAEMNRASLAAQAGAGGAELSRDGSQRRAQLTPTECRGLDRGSRPQPDAARADLHRRLPALGHDPARHVADEHARLHVLEELPVPREVEAAIGGEERSRTA